MQQLTIQDFGNLQHQQKTSYRMSQTVWLGFEIGMTVIEFVLVIDQN